MGRRRRTLGLVDTGVLSSPLVGRVYRCTAWRASAGWGRRSDSPTLARLLLSHEPDVRCSLGWPLFTPCATLSSSALASQASLQPASCRASASSSSTPVTALAVESSRQTFCPTIRSTWEGPWSTASTRATPSPVSSPATSTWTSTSPRPAQRASSSARMAPSQRQTPPLSSPPRPRTPSPPRRAPRPTPRSRPSSCPPARTTRAWSPSPARPRSAQARHSRSRRPSTPALSKGTRGPTRSRWEGTARSCATSSQRSRPRGARCTSMPRCRGSRISARAMASA